jgi:hypothetical protein
VNGFGRGRTGTSLDHGCIFSLFAYASNRQLQQLRNGTERLPSWNGYPAYGAPGPAPRPQRGVIERVARCRGRASGGSPPMLKAEVMINMKGTQLVVARSN